MCNCNQQRASYSSPDTLQRGMVKVKLIGATPLVVNGNITGRMYVFRNPNDTAWMDKRDALQLADRNDLQVLM